MRDQQPSRAMRQYAKLVERLSPRSDILQGLLRAMTAEGKLLAGASVYEDPDVPPAGDSAGFVIEANDVDALEKVYFTYRFSFAQA